MLVVNQGADVSVILHNDLPANTGATSVAFTGQGLAPDTGGVAPASSNVGSPYHFVASAPGTFLYEAGLTANGPQQVAMGLFGALIVRPTVSPDRAYGSANSAFDDEAVVVLSEIDPAFNADPLGFDLSAFQPTYRLINGKAYPDTDPIVSGAGRKLLLRYLNAGLDNHSMGLLGRHQKVVGNHGHEQQHSYSVVAETIASGTTLDTIVTMPPSAPAGTRYALYEPADRLHNAGALTGSQVAFGGMLTFLDIDTGSSAADAAGPTTAGVQAAPTPSNGTGTVQLTANTDDALSGGSNVAAAEWSEGTTAAPAGTGNAMTAVDGAFDEPTEPVQAAVPVGSLSDGIHTWWVRARDAALNWGAAVSTTDVIDRTGPLTTGLVLAPNPTSGSSSVTVKATGNDTATGGSKVAEARFFVDSATCSGSATVFPLVGAPASTVSLSGTIAAPIPAGVHAVSAQSRDAAGNWGPCANAATPLSVDVVPPSVTGVAAAPNPTSAASVTLTANASDVSSGNSKLVGAEWSEGAVAAAPGSGHAMTAVVAPFDNPTEALTAAVNTTGFAIGNHKLWVRARDAAGNWSVPISTTLNFLALFVDSFGSGNFSAWNGGSSGPGLSVTAAASMVGSPAFGMQATVGGSTTARYVQDDHPANETSYHARFSFNPHGTTTANAEHDIFVGRNTAGTSIFRIQYRKNGTNYQVRALVRSTGGESATSWYTITNASHFVEIAWASGSSAEFRLYVDNAQKQKFINLNTSTFLLDSVRLGPAAGLKTSMSGTEYFDDFKSTRTTLIGP
jgi:hypothetical protein